MSADTIVPGGGSLTVAPNDATALAAWGQKGAAANPQQLNRYSYVLNNPLKSTDPTGHCLGPVIVVCVVIVGEFVADVVIPAVVGAVVIAGAAEAGKQLGEAQRAATNESQDQAVPPDLTDDKGKDHILDGDSTGGGHRPGTGIPGKSEFPPSWSDEKILGEISDVATDPASHREPQPDGRVVVTGTRDGVDIRVIIGNRAEGGRIVTGYPTNLPRNPRGGGSGGGKKS